MRKNNQTSHLIQTSFGILLLVLSLILNSCGGGDSSNDQDDYSESDNNSNGSNNGENFFDSAYSVSAGGHHTCANSNNYNFICWGSNEYRQLGGHFDEEYIGDNEVPADFGMVPLQQYGIFEAVDAGQRHTCVLTTTGEVGCFGFDGAGRLGHGPSGPGGPVKVGKSVSQITAGDEHTCVVTSDGKIRCWGDNGYGRLGYGNTQDIGDNEYPESAGDVPLGNATFIQVSAGNHHTCALSSNNDVYCWGNNYYGQIGVGKSTNLGDDETPDVVGPILSGAKAVDVGGDSSCVLSLDGYVLCWGKGDSGRLGNGSEEDIGDNEFVDVNAKVPLAGKAIQVSVGQASACALLEGGGVQCWGSNNYGQLGYSGVENVGGYGLMPVDVGLVDLGGTAEQISVGRFHACAVMSTGTVRCWGKGEEGQLGYGLPQDIGDVFDPAEYYLEILGINGDVAL